MRLLISAGGTGGGVYPALAVAGALGKRADVLWVGSEHGMEESLVRRNEIAFRAVPAAGLHGVGLRALPGNMLQLARGTARARGILRSFDPDVLFFTGGFVSVPIASAGLRRPSVTFVPDVEPALAQRWISMFADRVCVTTETAVGHYRRPERVRATGYPHRFGADNPEPETARRLLGLVGDQPVLLVLGGSRGARSINRALWAGLDQILDHAQVVHVTGELDWPEHGGRVSHLSQAARAGYHPYPYLHEEMGAALAAADLALSRAGASVLGEYPAFGLPSILVPYPHAWRYQHGNAAYLEQRGAARIVDDERLQVDLVGQVLQLLGDRTQLEAMSARSRALDRPGAAERVAEQLIEAAQVRRHP